MTYSYDSSGGPEHAPGGRARRYVLYRLDAGTWRRVLTTTYATAARVVRRSYATDGALYGVVALPEDASAPEVAPAGATVYLEPGAEPPR